VSSPLPAPEKPKRPTVLRIAGAPKAARPAVAMQELDLFSATGAAKAKWAMRMYAEVPAVYAAVSRVASDIASLPFIITAGPKADDPALERSALADLLDRPNPLMGFSELVEAIVIYLETCGAAYVLMDTLSPNLAAGTVKELWPLKPDEVTPLVNQREVISGYRYGGLASTKELPAEAVMPFLYFDPVHPIGGHLPPLVAAQIPINAWGQASTWNVAFFENGAQPGLIVTIPHQLEEGQRESLRREIKNQWVGAKNAHRVLVLDNFQGEVKTADNPHKEMGFSELIKVAREEICSAIGVPKALIGDTGGLNLAQVQEATTIYWTSQLVPLAKRVERVINRWLRPRVDEGSWFHFDLSEVKELQEDETAILERKGQRIRYGLATPNQILEEDGASDLQYPDGDQHYMDGTLVPIPRPEPIADQDEDGAVPSDQAGGDDDRPGEQDEGDSRGSSLHVVRSPDAVEIERTARWRRFDARLTTGEQKMLRVWRPFLRTLEREVMQAVRKDPPVLPARAEQDVTPLVIPLPKPAEDYMPEREDLFRAVLDKHGKVYEWILANFGEAAVREISEALVFDAGTPRVLALVNRDRERIGDALFQLLADVRDTLEAGLNQGETMKDLAGRLHAQMGPARAMRIARTEAMAAANSGTFEGYQQTGVEQHEWLSARDSRVRDTHRGADGQRRPVGEAFSVGGSDLLFPGDPAGPPGETVNCRCTLMPVVL